LIRRLGTPRCLRLRCGACGPLPLLLLALECVAGCAAIRPCVDCCDAILSNAIGGMVVYGLCTCVVESLSQNNVT
jgi:hypothetical protein